MRPVLACTFLWALGCGARTGLSESTDGGVAELCNGVDDDGDGLVDEGIAALSCGVGACRDEVPGCVSGRVPSCTPRPPGVEVCNGRDDDCDGSVDEELPWGPVAGPYTVWDDEGIGALDLELETVEDGMLLTFRSGFDGSHPQPNVWVARLDRDGLPRGAAHTLFERNATQGPRVFPSSEGRHLLTFCGRWGFEDRASSAFMDSTGERVATERVRSPGDRHCGAEEPEGVWTGRAHLFSWTTNSSSPDGDYVLLLDVANREGVSGRWEPLARDAYLSTPPRMALQGDRVLLVAGVRTSDPRRADLWLWNMDLDGGVIGAPVVRAAPEGALLGAAHVVPRAGGGFLVVAENRFDAGVWRLLVGADGSVGRWTPLEGIPQRVDLGSALERGAGAGYVYAGNIDGAGRTFYGFVARLDAAAEVTDLWRSDGSEEEPWIGWPGIAAREGRVFVAYWAPDPTQEVRVREFGCVE